MLMKKERNCRAAIEEGSGKSPSLPQMTLAGHPREAAEAPKWHSSCRENGQRLRWEGGTRRGTAAGQKWSNGPIFGGFRCKD